VARVTSYRVPGCLTVGARRPGTVSLSRCPHEHPDVLLPRSEVHYFDRQSNRSRGPAWYAEHFKRLAAVMRR
jgi:hypothetical protein